MARGWSLIRERAGKGLGEGRAPTFGDTKNKFSKYISYNEKDFHVVTVAA